MLGGVVTSNRYAGDLAGVRPRFIFQELGLTYLHIMHYSTALSLSRRRYAVTNYRKVMPTLGTIDQLRDLATELRRNGINLVWHGFSTILVTSTKWAKQAAAGNPEYSAYY